MPVLVQILISASILADTFCSIWAHLGEYARQHRGRGLEGARDELKKVEKNLRREALVYRLHD